MSSLLPSTDDTLTGGVGDPSSLLTGGVSDLGSASTTTGRPRGTSDLAYTDTVAWSAQTDISASDIVEKQRLIKDITGMQEGLKGLMSRITSVKADCTKAEADNEMLQVYIDSVTKSLAAKS